MLHCAVCDDNKPEVEALYSMIREYPAELDCGVFSDPLALMSAVRGGKRFDIYVLDIMMPGMTGVDLARGIRGIDGDGVILFLTSSDDFHRDAYDVEALQYLDKPANREEIFHAFDRALRYLGSEKEHILPVQTKEGIRALPVGQIVFAESYRHVITLHLRDGRTIDTLDSSLTLTKLMQSLCYPPFCVPARGFIVNLSYVDCLGKLQFNMTTGDVIQIPQKQFSKVRQQYSDYLLTRYAKGED